MAGPSLGDAYDDLRSLRVMAKRGQRAVGQKISKLRNRESNPVELSGTRYDVRVPAQRIDRLNSTQLKSLIAKQNNFRSRSTNFVQLADDKILSAQRYRKTTRLHRQYNKLAQARQDQVANLKVRGGLTIAEREAAFTPKFRTIGGFQNNSLLSPKKLNANEIDGMKALAKIERDFRRKLASGYHPKALKSRRQKSARVMIKTSGDSELLKEFDSLSDEQFDLLWNFRTGFAEAIDLYYGLETQAKDARWYDSTIGDQTRDAHELIAWAKSVSVGDLPQSPNPARAGRRLRNNNKPE